MSSPPNKPSNNGGSCDADPNKRPPSCGEPINPGTGNMWHTEHDYGGTAAMGDLSVVRTYNSSPYNWDASLMRTFGTRWTQPYDVTLKQESPSAQNTLAGTCWRRADTLYVWCEPPALDVTSTIPSTISIVRGDGKKYLFNRSGTSWVGDADTNDSVTALYNSDNTAILGWTYVSAQGNATERFDASGMLMSISSRTGATQRLTYSNGVTNDTRMGRTPADAPACSHVVPGDILPAGRLLCVTDDWGRQLQFEYDGKGRITKAIDPSEQAWLYEYDGPSGGCTTSTDLTNRACAANNLTRITTPDGSSRTYYYNESTYINGGAGCAGAVAIGNGFAHLLNSMTGLVDENGARYISWTYDCLGAATSSQRGDGINKVVLSYTDYNSSGTATTTVTHYTGKASNPQTTMRNYSYLKVLDVAKNSAIDQPCVECGPVKSRTYDANGNVASSTNWNGSKTTYLYDVARNLETRRTEAAGTAQERTITTAWHSAYRLPIVIAEPRKITAFIYDASGNLLTKTVQATTDSTGAQGLAATTVGAARVWRYTYNNIGQIVMANDPQANTIAYVYDASGNLSTITDGVDQVTTLSNYDANGRVGKIVEPNGSVTELAYSPRGWLISRTTGGETTTYDYDGVGQLMKVTLPDGASIAYTYDDAHRLTAMADSAGNRIVYTLDLRGNRIADQVTDPTGTLSRRSARVYDPLSRLQQATGSAQ